MVAMLWVKAEPPLQHELVRGHTGGLPELAGKVEAGERDGAGRLVDGYVAVQVGDHVCGHRLELTRRQASRGPEAASGWPRCSSISALERIMSRASIRSPTTNQPPGATAATIRSNTWSLARRWNSRLRE